VQRDEHSCEEQLVLLLQRQRETIDDGAEDFKELGDAIESLSLVNELEEDVVDRTTNVRAEVEELSVDAMKGGLEEIAFSWVLGVEKLQQLALVSNLFISDHELQLTFSTKL
jgi:hypothetical protein